MQEELSSITFWYEQKTLEKNLPGLCLDANLKLEPTENLANVIAAYLWEVGYSGQDSNFLAIRTAKIDESSGCHAIRKRGQRWPPIFSPSTAGQVCSNWLSTSWLLPFWK